MFLVRSTPATPGAPGTPTCTATAVDSSTISVAASGTAPAGWKSWEVLESTTFAGSYSVIASGIAPADMPYLRTGLAASTTRYYMVRGTTNAGQVSVESSIDDATTSSAPSSAFAPKFPRLAAVPISGPFSYYDNSTFVNLMAKFHIRIFTHFNQMQASQGWTRSMRDIMAAITAAEPGAMSVDGVNIIYVNNGECFNDQPGERRRVKYDTEKWWLYPTGISGTPVTSTFATNLWTTNITRYCPTDANGDNLIRWQAKLDVQQNVTGEPGNAANDQVHGFFLDNVFWKPRVDGDWDRDGTSDSKDDPTWADQYRRGLADYFDYIRTIWPTARFQGGNIADWPQAGTATSAISPLNDRLEFGVAEGLTGETWSVERWGGLDGLLRWYRFNEDALRDPKIQIFGARISSPTAYQEMRRAVAKCLVMGNGYAQIYTDYASNGQLWFDEFDNAGAGIEYLGAATDDRQTAANENGVWRRRFAAGVAYFNPTASPANITAYRALKRITGTQDAAVNSGATISNGATVSIPAYDGLILLNN